MGLPVERLVLATNRNDILTRFVNTGVYEADEVFPTISPSMDIQVSSNFERYLYYLMDENPDKVRELMEQMARTGRIEVPADKQHEVARVFQARAVSEDETLAQIKATYAACGYILDPHTAVGVRAAQDVPDAICLATADPAKFGDAVKQAIGVEAPPPPSLQGLMDKETRCELLAADSEEIKRFIQSALDHDQG
jgi:threonine synthase